MLILEVVKNKTQHLFATGAVTEVDVQFAIDEVEQVIKNYCNVDSVPPELLFTWANMSMDLVRYTFESNSAGNAAASSEVDIAEVSSLKIGDTQISLGGASKNNARSAALRSHSASLDGIVMNYKSQLNRYRRMVW